MATDTYTYTDYFLDLWRNLPGSKFLFFLMMCLRLIAGLGSFASLYFIGKVIDFFTTYSAGASLQLFYTYSILIVGFNVAAVLLRFFSKSYIQETGLKMQTDFRLKGFRKLLSLDLTWHENENTGNKISRIAGGADSVEKFMSMLSNELSAIVIGMGGVLAIFLFIGWKYIVFIVFFAFVFIFAEQYFAKQIYSRSKKLFKHEEKLTGNAFEISNNILSIKSLGLHNKMSNKLYTHEKKYRAFWKSRKGMGHWKGRLINSMIAIGHGLFLLLAGFDVVNGAITVGSLVVYLSYYSRFASEVSRYSTIAMNLVNFKVKFQRMIGIIREPINGLDKVNGKVISNSWEYIDFKDVSFAYKNKLILKNLSLKIRRNEKIGVVGLSGSGKSTLIKLLLRLYTPTKGEVKIDSTSIYNYSRASLRSLITVVLQDQELFNLSFKDNIYLTGKKNNITLLKKAIKKSSLDKLVVNLPQGINTLIGEKGYRLSGGERQRLGLARAIYRDSPIIILDEATSQLDSASEELIQKELKQLKDKTILVIAHRLATLKHLDRIIYIDKGRIKEEGTFKQLIRKKGLFYNLWKRQELNKRS